MIGRCRRVGAAPLLMVLLLSASPALAQQDVADAITDAPAPGFELVVSQRVEFSDLVDEGPTVGTDSWVKSFTDGTNSISIVATLFPDTKSLQSGVAGALAQIEPAERTASPVHTGVITGPVRQGSELIEFAVYGEGTIAFAIGAVGPDRLSVFQEALTTQLNHSTGERYRLGIDGTASDGGGTPSAMLYLVMVSAAIALMFGIVVAVRRREHRARGW